ncbi:MAG: 4Fe-4S binding protein [Proteobacteria bacterium]|nr:4Fe-4S binding protein [Pseudomonadota bacterium]
MVPYYPKNGWWRFVVRSVLRLSDMDGKNKTTAYNDGFLKNAQAAEGMKKSTGLRPVFIDFNRFNFKTAREQGKMLKVLAIFIRVIRGIFKARNIYHQEINTVKHLNTTADDNFWDSVRRKGNELGISLIGFAPVDEKLMCTNDQFGHITRLYSNAIVLAWEMDYNAIEAIPGFEVGIDGIKTYAELGDATNALTEFIRKQGHGAIACHPLGDVIILAAMGVRAGLGTFGRNGLLISKEFGPRQRVSMIATTASPLPPPDKAIDHFQDINDYCSKCGKCIRSCPSGAIRETPLRIDAYDMMSCVDAKKCIQYFYEFNSCGVCIKTCPFHSLGYDRLMRHREVPLAAAS